MGASKASEECVPQYDVGPQICMVDYRVVPRSTNEDGISKVQRVFRDMRKYYSKEFKGKHVTEIRGSRRDHKGFFVLHLQLQTTCGSDQC